MSILNVNQIQPVGSGQTVTISATNISTGSATVTAGTFTGNLTGNVTGNATGLSGSPTLSGITSVSTTNLTVNGSAYPSAGPLSNRNLIINGAMQVAQRGTSSTSTEFQTVDRFKTSTNGGTTTQSQETLSSGDPYDAGFRNFYRITNTTTGTDAAHYKIITHFIEAQNLANSGWNYSSAASNVTLSFWARASVGQDYTFYFRTDDGTGQAYSFNFTLAADTWTKVTHVVPGASAVVFNNDNGKGLQLTWAAWLGSDYIDSGHTNEAWAAIDTTSISNVSTTTWGTTTDATFDVTGVQLEVGSVATPFEHRSYGDELARCQRYHLQIGNEGRFSYQGGANNTNGFFSIAFPTKMRATPSFSYTGTITVNSYVASGTITNLQIDLIGPQVASLYSSGGISYSTSTNTLLYNTAAGNGQLLFSAEL